MKVFVSEDFTGHYPVGTSAIVVAVSEEQAIALLSKECRSHGLDGFDGTLKEIATDRAHAVVLADGNY